MKLSSKGFPTTFQWRFEIARRKHPGGGREELHSQCLLDGESSNAVWSVGLGKKKISNTLSED